MAETIFFVEPGGNLTRALKRKFSWMSIPEIEERKIPEVMRLNPHLTDPNVVRADVPYKVMDEEQKFPLEMPREAQTFDSFDVQGYGQRQEDEKRAMLSMSRSEINSLVDREEEKTSRVVRLAQAFGSNISYTPSRRAGGTTDPAKGIAKQSANMKFTENLMKAIATAPGGKLSDTEITSFLNSQNAGPAQIKIMKDMTDWVELKEMKTLFRINPATRELEHLSIYPYQITPEIRAAGWKDEATLKFQREVKKDVAGEKQTERLIEVQKLITALLPFPDKSNPPKEGEINWIPQNEEQYQKLKQQWGIKLPEAEALFREQLGVKAPGARKAYAYIKDGKQVTLMLTDREYTAKRKEKGYEGLLPYDIQTKETIAAQNDMISNLAAAERQRVENTELGQVAPEKVTPLTLLRFQEHAVDTWIKTTGRPIGDSERFNKQSASAFMGEQKKKEAFNSDLSTIMGQLPSYESWDDFDTKTKGMDNEAIIKAAEELERRKGDEWKYELDRVLFNAKGEPITISDYVGYVNARKGDYIYKEYNDAPDRPVPVASDRFWSTLPDQTSDLVPVKVEIKEFDEDGQETTRVATIWVHNVNREQHIVDTAKNTFDADIVAYEEINTQIDKIFSNLKSDEGLTQMAAVRMLEKLQDPGGVIRESDVALMKSAMGTLWDDLERLATVVFDRKPAFLSEQENDQVANTAMVALEVLQRHIKERLTRRKEQFLNDPYTTFTSRGVDKISFSRVMGEDRYKKYTTLKLPEWNYKTSKFGGGNITTQSAEDDALDALTN